MREILLSKIQFPEIQLLTRDAHKLRGYFGNLFRDHSELLHNHYADGQLRYAYPMVQYKVLNKTPTLIALNEGAELLTALFLKIKTIKTDENEYSINTKNIENKKISIGYSNELHNYRFQTLWMALNQKNYNSYVKMDAKDKSKLLDKILTGNILSFLKNMEIFLDSTERVLVKTSTTEKMTMFKGQKMMAFSGSFVTNVILPENIGLGKSVSRGFGTISTNIGD